MKHALKIVWWINKSIAKQGSATATTWKSGRADTSYVIYQECATPDPVLGLTINGRTQAYKVTGTGKPADNGGGDNGGGDNAGGDTGGNGSLGNLFGSS
ncbi:hypothetical protein [Gordonia sp. C13]|uniref:hypothetical protein n=1 Tax=Gordonia sp. C13 TaxID=2935078 RepID=UPI0027E2F9DC|nr:hypothetical protein [Gordonia sp. C13]